jgi:hypothetical protein
MFMSRLRESFALVAATCHRHVAFVFGSIPVPSKKKRGADGTSFFLEQGMGIECDHNH